MDGRLPQLLLLLIAASLGGCCGSQLCSARFEQPIEHLGQTPPNMPYSEPPCGFRTIGGPPNMAPPAEPGPLVANAPYPKFLPVPTRPVFGYREASFAMPPPAMEGPEMAPQLPAAGENTMLDGSPPGFEDSADPPAPIDEGPPEELNPGPMKPMPRIDSPETMKPLPTPTEDSVARQPGILDRASYLRSRIRIR